MRHLFGYSDQPNFPPRYNVAPTQPIPVVISENGARRFRLMRWGLLPSWVKDPRKFALVINARSETVLEKPAFKNAMKRRRCLVPADGYYEWQTTENRKQPFFIHPRSGGPFGFAALAETWIGPNGEELDTVALVTAAASSAMTELHHRVPVTLAPRDFERWLDGGLMGPEEAMDMLVAPEDGSFVWYPVSTRVNKVANDDEQLVLPMTPEQLEAEAPKPKKAKTASPRKIVAADDDDGEQGSLF